MFLKFEWSDWHRDEEVRHIVDAFKVQLHFFSTKCSHCPWRGIQYSILNDLHMYTTYYMYVCMYIYIYGHDIIIYRYTPFSTQWMFMMHGCNPSKGLGFGQICTVIFYMEIDHAGFIDDCPIETSIYRARSIATFDSEKDYLFNLFMYSYLIYCFPWVISHNRIEHGPLQMILPHSESFIDSWCVDVFHCYVWLCLHVFILSVSKHKSPFSALFFTECPISNMKHLPWWITIKYHDSSPFTIMSHHQQSQNEELPNLSMSHRRFVLHKVAKEEAGIGKERRSSRPSNRRDRMVNTNTSIWIYPPVIWHSYGKWP